MHAMSLFFGDKLRIIKMYKQLRKRVSMNSKVLFIISIFISAGFAAEYNEHYNLVQNPYGEDSFTGWYHTNAYILNESAGAGDKCFLLSPELGNYAQIRSHKMSIDAKQDLKVGFSFKSLQGSNINPGSCYGMFRFFDASGNNLGARKFELAETDNNWQSFSDIITAPAGTDKMDVRLVVNMNGSAGASGDFLFDDIFVHRELHPLGVQPSGSIPNTIYYIDKSSYILNGKPHYFLLMQSLQGIVAQTSPQIYINEGDQTYLNDLETRYGFSTVNKNSLYWYLNNFKSHIDGYILYDLNDRQSMLAASSMAGIRNAIIVDVNYEAEFLSSFGDPIGITKIMDVRGKDCWWVYQNYWDEFNHNGIAMKQPDPSEDPSAYYMRDLAIAQKLMWWWDSDSARTDEVLDKVIDNSHCWGWDDPSAPGELAATELHSGYSLYTGATAAVCNLSLYSAMDEKFPDMTFEQKNDDNEYAAEDNVHYVCFMMSDMDNIGTELGNYGWHVDPKYFGNSNRGDFPMGWGMPASFVELAPTVMKWWYDNATENDSFTAACSGLGYMYSSYFPDLENHTRKTEQLIEKGNLRTCVIADKWYPNSMTESSYYPYASKYSRLDNIRGMFYFDVKGDYARYNGDILWFDGKPMVTCRYTLWDDGQYDGVSRNADDLADSLNSRPANPYSESGYSFVMVHAWSYGLDEVKETINQLDSNVKVVTPVEMIEQIHMHMSPCGTAPIRADINNDCDVDFQDYSEMADDWMTVGNDSTDVWEDGKTDAKDMQEFFENWLNL